MGVCQLTPRSQWENLHVTVKDQASGILIGYGSHNETFQVSALETSTVSVDIDIVASATQLTNIVLNECVLAGHVTFISSGTCTWQGYIKERVAGILTHVP